MVKDKATKQVRRTQGDGTMKFNLHMFSLGFASGLTGLFIAFLWVMQIINGFIAVPLCVVALYIMERNSQEYVLEQEMEQ